MSLVLLVMLTGGLVFAIGLVAHLLSGDRVRRIVSLNVASGGVMMILLALALRGGEAGEIVRPDPVPQALVLTGIVIMAAITGLALALARRIRSAEDENESGDPDEDADTQGAPAIQAPRQDRDDGVDP